MNLKFLGEYQDLVIPDDRRIEIEFSEEYLVETVATSGEVFVQAK